MTIHPFPTPEAGFDDWWSLIPSQLRMKKAVCKSKWDHITNGGLDTTTLDKDSGKYIPLHLQATPEEIIEGTRAWVESLPMNADYSYKDIQYQVRAPQFLNQGRWLDFV